MDGYAIVLSTDSEVIRVIRSTVRETRCVCKNLFEEDPNCRFQSIV